MLEKESERNNSFKTLLLGHQSIPHRIIYSTQLEQLIRHIIPSFRILKLLEDTNAFEKWLQEYHNIDFTNDIFNGYKFFVECAFSEIFHSSSNEDGFDIKTGVLLKCAMYEGIYPLSKLPNECERTVFLKNIYGEFSPVLRAKSMEDLGNNVELFNESVGKQFEEVFNNCFRLVDNTALSYNEAVNLLIIENLFLGFNQINPGGPMAYSRSLYDTYLVPDGKLKYCFKGYKLTLQYIWSLVLEKNMFEKARLHNLHLADSWKTYIYKEVEPNASEIEKILNSSIYNLEIQTCLDSYFDHIKYNVIEPIEDELGKSILSLSSLFERNSYVHSKEVFKGLLSTNEIGLCPYESLSDADKINIALYWYPIEIFVPGNLHNGISAFITSLVGTVTLSDSITEKELEIVKVRKFIHPCGQGKNDYSYAVLIDTYAAVGHYHSGWQLYFDCCGDYSGFSGSEFRKVEALIHEFEEKGKVESKELVVSKDLLRKYMANFIGEKEGFSIDQIKIIEEEIKNKSEYKKSKSDDVIGKAKAVILELLMCYVLSKKNNIRDVSWSISKSKGEIDIILKSSERVKIIECKVSPNNCDLNKEYQKLLNKLSNIEYSEFPNRECEFWFWNKPSIQNSRLLKEKGIPYNYLNNADRKDHLMAGVGLRNIRYIMNYKL